MRRKRHSGAKGFGFSNERFLELMTSITGVSPVGILGRETPLDLSSLESARGSLMMREIFSKYDDGKPSEDKEKTTWKKFQEAEDLCLDSNFWIPRTFRHSPFWRAVSMRLRQVLGSFSWDEASRYFSFGPGATTRLTRKEAAAAYKYSGVPESTLGNAVLASCAIRMNPMWNSHVVQSLGEESDHLVRVVSGNSVIAVPKNFKTDRTIAKEPCMNIYVQKGIGQCIRNRLKRVGINLNSQVENQLAAREGSMTGGLATIDLSMASDTLSFALVEFLLPNDWWYALEQCRSPVGVLPSGEVLTYQKFSSMGNGYTFELETLIFWAIAQCVACPNINEMDSRILVYGDDIVVPTDQAETLLMRLWQAGFKPNLQKSFWEGPYRESCGKHYFLGVEITPFYIRKPVKYLHRLFLVHNNLFRWLERAGLDRSEALKQLRDMAPASWRSPRLPDGYGDGAFIGFVDELRLDPHPYGWEYWTVRALNNLQTVQEDDLPFGQLIASILALATPINSEYERNLGLFEHVCGLPVREGKYVEMSINVPRHALSS